MIVDLDRLPEDGVQYEGEEDSSIFGLDDKEYVHYKSPVHYDLHVSLVSNELITRGEISMTAEFACSRCAVFMPVFIRESAFFKAIEVDQETQSVDLTEDIREAMLLLFPAYPVCSPECKGLCPQCGTNYNEASCKCEKPADNCWGMLNNLTIEE